MPKGSEKFTKKGWKCRRKVADLTQILIPCSGQEKAYCLPGKQLANVCHPFCLFRRIVGYASRFSLEMLESFGRWSMLQTHVCECEMALVELKEAIVSYTNLAFCIIPIYTVKFAYNMLNILITNSMYIVWYSWVIIINKLYLCALFWTAEDLICKAQKHIKALYYHILFYWRYQVW